MRLDGAVERSVGKEMVAGFGWKDAEYGVDAETDDDETRGALEDEHAIR